MEGLPVFLSALLDDLGGGKLRCRGLVGPAEREEIIPQNCLSRLGWGPSVRYRSLGQKREESGVSMRPLSGIGLGMITPKAKMRSVATSRRVSPKLLISRTLPLAFNFSLGK